LENYPLSIFPFPGRFVIDYELFALQQRCSGGSQILSASEGHPNHPIVKDINTSTEIPRCITFVGHKISNIEGCGRRYFLSYATLMSVIQLLTQILYAGITEVQIIQWYVEEGAHIEEWKPLCQYQSDKAVDDVSEFFSISLFTYLTIYQSR
jgi:hypothetical protein